ncbi:tetratricopeptide repeat protein [Flavobacterium amniphilum]|uniref:tetratricopeptide repeat protein n=1 Tax=Flavobacterium amniphilum TaxID=1834035 RepID=UPI002029DD2C|nr:tetratricopeptide repeat protein [Flavobacterium amniphilum]MCL9806557.1 tetratricopeptide repeat protein [Flavobacterium amniphilum]
MKKNILLAFILFSFCFTSTGQNKYKELDALLNKNSMIDAMTVLEKLKDNPKKDTLDAEYWLRYSKASFTLYKYENAKAAIDKSIKLAPQNAAYHFEKGLMLNRIGEPENALIALQRAVELKPKGEYHYWKGIVNQQLNKLKDAEEDYKSALANGFETPELHNNYTNILMINEKFTESLIHANKAVAMDKKNGMAYSTRSKNHLYLLNVDAACADKSAAYDLGYMRVFQIPDTICKGSFIQKMKFAGDYCAGSNMYKQAIKAYSALIDKKEYQSDIFLNRGYCYYKLKEYANAEKDYLKALELPNPVKDLLYDNLSLLYFDQDNYTKSIEYSSKRIELNPKNHVPYIDRGLNYRKLKKYDEAEKDFNKSLSIKPDFFRAYGYRAFLFLELGQYRQSLEDASKSVEINPKYAYGYLVLAQAKQKLGQTDFCTDLLNAQKYGNDEADIAIKQYCN